MADDNSNDPVRLFPRIETVERIFHVADVHIRNYQRHDEYREVFNRLLESIEANKVENESIAVVVGDIVHSKTDMSPELFMVARRFLKDMANTLPTLLVPGNHDELENNPERLDALTPITDDLYNKNFEYVRTSGLFLVGNTLFSHMHFADDPEKWVTPNEIENKEQYDELVALYHDVVDQSETDVGFVMESGRMKASYFTGFDKVMLGDIHKRQRLSSYEVQQLTVPDDEVELYQQRGWSLV